MSLVIKDLLGVKLSLCVGVEGVMLDHLICILGEVVDQKLIINFKLKDIMPPRSEHGSIHLQSQHLGDKNKGIAVSSGQNR